MSSAGLQETTLYLCSDSNRSSQIECFIFFHLKSFALLIHTSANPADKRKQKLIPFRLLATQKGQDFWHLDVLYYILTSGILNFTSWSKGPSAAPKACDLLAGVVCCLATWSHWPLARLICVWVFSCIVWTQRSLKVNLSSLCFIVPVGPHDNRHWLQKTHTEIH